MRDIGREIGAGGHEHAIEWTHEGDVTRIDFRIFLEGRRGEDDTITFLVAPARKGGFEVIGEMLLKGQPIELDRFAEPKLLICDEPVSSLDTSLRAQVMNVFLSLRDELGVAIVLIAHDLALVRQASARVNVMYLGRIVESGPSDALYAEPLHPYSRALTSAILGIDPEIERHREGTALKGDLPSPFAPPSGCSFHPRCPHANARCSSERPALQTFKRVQIGVQVACHAVEEGRI